MREGHGFIEYGSKKWIFGHFEIDTGNCLVVFLVHVVGIKMLHDGFKNHDAKGEYINTFIICQVIRKDHFTVHRIRICANIRCHVLWSSHLGKHFAISCFTGLQCSAKICNLGQIVLIQDYILPCNCYYCTL